MGVMQMMLGGGPYGEPIRATGGTKFAYGGKSIHQFTGPGNFIISEGEADCEVIVVAGGGGGGAFRLCLIHI